MGTTNEAPVSGVAAAAGNNPAPRVVVVAKALVAPGPCAEPAVLPPTSLTVPHVPTTRLKSPRASSDFIFTKYEHSKFLIRDDRPGVIECEGLFAP